MPETVDQPKRARGRPKKYDIEEEKNMHMKNKLRNA